MEELEPGGMRLFSVVGDVMYRHAYGNWLTVLNEALVRASVIIYMKDKSANIDLDKLTHKDISLGFFWLPDLIILLDKYSHEREIYPALENFMPQIISYYNNIEITDSTKFPEVEFCSVENNSTIDASLDVILIRFNVPMKDKGYGFSYGKGGKETFPHFKSKEIKWIDSRTLEVHVGLTSGKHYSFTLYEPTYFSTNGLPLINGFELEFTTNP